MVYIMEKSGFKKLVSELRSAVLFSGLCNFLTCTKDYMAHAKLDLEIRHVVIW